MKEPCSKTVFAVFLVGLMLTPLGIGARQDKAGPFTQYETRLQWQNEGELYWIEAFGPDALRFRSSKSLRIADEDLTLLPQPPIQPEITITDERMTRFWISLDEAVKLVMDGLSHMQGGEIFVPRIPSMKIIDLARAVAPDCRIKTIGIRPGEKLHEALITEEDGRNTIRYNGMYIVMPQHEWWERKNYTNATKLPEGFSYTSDNNKEWMSVDDLRMVISAN